MLQIPEGLQMGSKQAAGEYAIPAGIEFIFDTSFLPIYHPSGALDLPPWWVYQSILYLLSRNRFYSCPFITFPLKSELLSGEAFM